MSSAARLRPPQAVWRQLSSASHKDKKVEDLLKLIVCPMTKTPLTFDRDRCCCKMLFLFAGSCTAAPATRKEPLASMGTGSCSAFVCHAPVHADTLAGAHTHVPADTQWRVYTTGKSSSRRLRDWHSRWSMAFPTWSLQTQRSCLNQSNVLLIRVGRIWGQCCALIFPY